MTERPVAADRLPDPAPQGCSNAPSCTCSGHARPGEPAVIPARTIHKPSCALNPCATAAAYVDSHPELCTCGEVPQPLISFYGSVGQIRELFSRLEMAPHEEHSGPFCPICGLMSFLRAALADAHTFGNSPVSAAVSPAEPPEAVYREIAAERVRQDAKWGGVPGIDRRDDHTYAAVLGEEFGEVCKAWLERDVAGLREELVQTAAVAVAWIAELDNGGGEPRGR